MGGSVAVAFNSCQSTNTPGTLIAEWSKYFGGGLANTNMTYKAHILQKKNANSFFDTLNHKY